jgi:hypothetical protein
MVKRNQRSLHPPATGPALGDDPRHGSHPRQGHGRIESRTVKPHHRRPASGVPGLVSRLVGGVGVVSAACYQPVTLGGMTALALLLILGVVFPRCGHGMRRGDARRQSCCDSCSPRWSVLESPQSQPRRPSGKNDRSRIDWGHPGSHRPCPRMSKVDLSGGGDGNETEAQATHCSTRNRMHPPRRNSTSSNNAINTVN